MQYKITWHEQQGKYDPFQKMKQSIQTKHKIMQMLELADNDFKVDTTLKLNGIKKNLLLMNLEN